MNSTFWDGDKDVFDLCILFGEKVYKLGLKKNGIKKKCNNLNKKKLNIILCLL